MSDIFNHEADAWDSLNDDYYEPVNLPPKLVVCKHCGTRGLRWKQLESGWRLHSFNSKILKLEVHNCL